LVLDLSSSLIEYDSGNTDEEEMDFTSANENAPPEDEHTLETIMSTKV
jgi:hypothetical protein